MRDISEKVSYLQGLSEGLNITGGSPQGKIISGILNVLNEIADEISGIQTKFDEMQEYIESVDDDLLDLEESVLDDDYMELECRNCGEQLYIESDIMDDEDVIEVTCPRCNEVIFINDGSFDHEHISVDEEFEVGESRPS
ncbi:MAG: AraC family transcriptional regulator [Firmicutes bacterium HGW-Firmicutes-15]|nr:MAG: AraC family transcriptional regulator [Firmicutes bacterium HGW-Firmicutes-15]